ncbi:YbaK/EbsC protein [Peptoanaerobacter stomatis]|uniref:Cys-tRNA(Pro)/Cys-tRNA(Cys) deacylase n=1 Tax=Peptoanaerobacter stomatis TaxID=796937 RepID=J5UMK9_9FIRM|nr:Cys-tRNA(Pro) deacylase [Peptoanaerobacter stomatis]EJU23674.1 YbaK/EbsC protein [Peptoanaerobacter stomatis]NWO24302.1 Cys-tRNA(Pro) deacylase [Peptostreptococcaceae bacterium oral taxon 081]
MSDKKTNAVRAVENLKIDYEILKYEVDDEHIDAISVANLIGQDIKYVYKTLVLQGSDKNYYVCVIMGNDELDLKKTAKAFGIKNIGMIPVSDINKITGYIRGGCSPIGMKKRFKTLIDVKAQRLEYIIVSAGQRGMQIKLDVNKLREIVDAKFEDLVKN